MLTIKTPATSANIGVGFDTLGLALNLYNVFTFEKSDDFYVSGFDASTKQNENYVLKAYLAFAQKHHIKPIPIHIQLVQNDIPIARGLGSSASCLLAGVLACNYINQLNQTLFDCASFASDMEGHSDNVFACAYGGFTASFMHDHVYEHDTFKVSNTLRFFVLIPQRGENTETLRDILPEKVCRKSAVHNLSRMIFIPKAFKDGNLKLLRKLLKDDLHEKYRMHTIPYRKDIEKLQEQGAISMISGSGPTMLLISKTALKATSDRYMFKEVYVSKGIEVHIS